MRFVWWAQGGRKHKPLNSLVGLAAIGLKAAAKAVEKDQVRRLKKTVMFNWGTEILGGGNSNIFHFFTYLGR